MKPTMEQETAIARIMQERGISRKSAVQFVRRGKKSTAAPNAEAMRATHEPETDDAPAIVLPAAPPTPKQRKPRVGKSAKFDDVEAVRLYQAGTKVVDIAVAMGYERGHGQNRVRTALIKAGVYKG